jgi:hypothetical protein
MFTNCFCIFSNNNNNNNNSYVDYTLNFNYKGCGKTINHTTKQITYWRHIRLTLNLETNSFDGVGYSFFRRRRFDFLLLGTILNPDNIGNGILYIEFVKYNYTTNSSFTNSIKYLGTFDIHTKKLCIISDISKGELLLQLI